jgi:hypothetical protein
LEGTFTFVSRLKFERRWLVAVTNKTRHQN